MSKETSRITTLSDLFYALFRCSPGDAAVIQGHERPDREQLLWMFFPDELCTQYVNKSKSNLTWFFNQDSKNKAVKRSLLRMITMDVSGVLKSVYRKTYELLWPDGQHAAFSHQSLWAVLEAVWIPSSIQAKLKIAEQSNMRTDTVSLLHAFYQANPAAALARIILTLSILPEAKQEILEQIWSLEGPVAIDNFDDCSVEGYSRMGKTLYLLGQHEQAFQCFEKAAKLLGQHAQTYEQSELYCKIGTMLSTGDGHYRDITAACRYFELGCLDENPESWYLLAKHTSAEKSRDALERSARAGYMPAVRELGNAFFFGRNHETNIEKARECFVQGLNDPSEDGAYCAYMLGRCYEQENNLDAAINAYVLAREHGSPEAAERISMLNPQEAIQETLPESSEDTSAGYCILNASDGQCRMLASSLPKNWKIITVVSDNLRQVLSDLTEQLYTSAADIFPKCILGFLSGDHQRNLEQAIEAISFLEQAAIRCDSRKWDFSSAMKLYVLAEERYASLLLDSALSGPHRVVLPIELRDPARDGAEELLFRAPLFLPCLQHPEISSINMVVLGSGYSAMAVVKTAVTLPLPEGYCVNIHIFGTETEKAKSQFLEECPGIMDSTSEIRHCIPIFHECDLFHGNLAGMLRALRSSRLSQNGVTDREAECLGSGNYYVVAAGDDRENIELAVQLRTELLKLDPSFTNLPFIAVRVENATTAWLTGNMRSDSKSVRHSWYDQYDLFCFGSNGMYAWQKLNDDIIEKRAQAVHLFYVGAEQPQQKAMALYYQRQYNRNSSRAVVMYLYYRLFAAGILVPDWRMYRLSEVEQQLAEAYRQWLEDPAHLESAIKLEHERWNCFMLASGWERATISQMNTYIQRGNPHHQMYLAKLHPFLCPWEALADGKLLEAAKEAIHSRFPEKNIHDPRIADAQTSSLTAMLLNVR